MLHFMYLSINEQGTLLGIHLKMYAFTHSDAKCNNSIYARKCVDVHKWPPKIRCMVVLFNCLLKVQIVNVLNMPYKSVPYS